MNIDKNTKDKKQELLAYFRDRASEFLTDVKTKFAATQSDKRARAINEKLNQTKDNLIATLLQKAEKEKWTNQEKLETILMITYCHIVVMIESRNSVRHMSIWTFQEELASCGTRFANFVSTIQSMMFHCLFRLYSRKSKRNLQMKSLNTLII